MRKSIKPIYVLDIEVECNDCWNNVAASIVNHLKNVKKKYLWSDDELTAYNDLIETILGLIKSHKFEILRNYQSRKSYAYYIDFLPNGSSEVIEIRFRITDHSKRSLNDETAFSDSAPIIKSFVMGSKRYSNLVDIYKAVKNICDDLSKGDYSALSKY